MLRLDHFVIHIDNDFEKINNLKKEFNKLNLPFNPKKGKGTKGFKVINFWSGEQYLEMLYLKNLEGGGWKSEWIDKYNQGKRGVFGICLFTDSLDEIKAGLMKSLVSKKPSRNDDCMKAFDVFLFFCLIDPCNNVLDDVLGNICRDFVLTWKTEFPVTLREEVIQFRVFFELNIPAV
ncbi:hypothetical protein Bmyc01_46110 [Bacillus mycoides]|nr:hypothetical protein Bmyc01_46110 [Bacillus mycoides]